MMIKNHIQTFRFHFLKNTLLGSMIYIGIIGSILFSLLIFLETLFYFSPSIKLFVLFLLTILLLIFIFYWIVIFHMTKNEKIKSYRLNKFALILGEKLFPSKKDTIINALQLEDGAKYNESKLLAESYIQSILKKLKKFDISLLIKKDRTKLKSIMLSTWIIIIVTFLFMFP